MVRIAAASDRRQEDPAQANASNCFCAAVHLDRRVRARSNRHCACRSLASHGKDDPNVQLDIRIIVLILVKASGFEQGGIDVAASCQGNGKVPPRLLVGRVQFADSPIICDGRRHVAAPEGRRSRVEVSLYEIGPGAGEGAPRWPPPPADAR